MKPIQQYLKRKAKENSITEEQQPKKQKLSRELAKLEDTKTFKDAQKKSIQKKNEEDLAKLLKAIHNNNKQDAEKYALSLGSKINENTIKLSEFFDDFYMQKTTDMICSPLFYAIFSHNLEAAKGILTHKLLVDVHSVAHRDEWKTSILYMAVDFGDQELINMIIENGGDIFHADKAGFLPIHAAIARGDTGITKHIMQIMNNKDHSFNFKKFFTNDLQNAVETPFSIALKEGIEQNPEIGNFILGAFEF